MLSTEMVWSRRELIGEQISDQQYNLVIGAVLSWGFILNFLMVKLIPAQAVLGINHWAFILGYLASTIAGTMIYSKSDNPAVSFAGYNLVVLPLGLVLVRFLHFYDSDVISQAFLATAFVTMAMMTAAAIRPQFFLSLRGALGVAFIAAFLVELGMGIFMGSFPPIFDWIFVLIFAGYIGYDWARAQALPKTLDNAVDCAASLYVDIVILFIRLVRIFGRRD